MKLLQGLNELGYSFLVIGENTIGEVQQPAGEAPQGGEQGGGLFGGSMIFMWVAMFAALYFFIIRPQRKRDKAQKEMQSALKVGDRVVTTSGMFGKIVSVGTDAFMLEFGDVRGIRVPVRKTDVVGIKTPNMSPPGSEPMPLEDTKEDKKEDKKDKKSSDKDEKKDDK
ncbi:MAG: preprotein translocase subunit YajC [Defluviitaleaceae bacterium]|nr:preprotein translocase subunit YajC [Defluviitaleaceae bacterium]MCL2835798.1 preprotein translocase subunit YajC [Defluviitaleaceae bacterium]